MARREAQRLQGEADSALVEAKALKLQARLLARGRRTRNVYLGCCKKMDAAEARQKARAMKAEALGIKRS